MLEPKDDLRHSLRPGPFSRESLFHNVLLPDDGLMAFLYTWVNADDQGGYLFAVVGEDDHRYAFGAADGIDVGRADFDDWAVGGAWLRHTELLQRAEFGAATDTATLTARFEGLHEAFDYARNEDGCPDFVADNRFEQAARVTGELVLDGRRIPFDTTGHRDHSWGTRDWASMQDWKWVSAQTVDGSAQLNVMVLHARGETTVHGYVVVDGELSPVASVRTKADFDRNWWQTGLGMTVLDAAGRTTVISATRYALLAFEAGPMALREAGCRATLDGRDALLHFECGWDAAYAAAQAERMAAASG